LRLLLLKLLAKLQPLLAKLQPLLAKLQLMPAKLLKLLLPLLTLLLLTLLLLLALLQPLLAKLQLPLALLLMLPLPLLPSNFGARNEKNRPSGRFFFVCMSRNCRLMRQKLNGQSENRTGAPLSLLISGTASHRCVRWLAPDAAAAGYTRCADSVAPDASQSPDRA